MNLTDTYTLRYNDPGFAGRVTVAIARLAQSIESEDPSTPNHDIRLLYAQQWFAQVEGTASTIMWNVVSSDSIQVSGTASDDPTIQAAVDVILLAQIPPAS